MNDEQIEALRTKYGFDRIGIIEGEMFLPMKEVFEKLVQKWILYDKELPPHPQENPVFDGKQLELYLVCTTYTDYPFRAFWNGKCFADGMCKIEDVIAWMPLPETYKEEGVD